MDDIWEKHCIKPDSKYYQPMIDRGEAIITRGFFGHAVLDTIEQHCMQFVPMTEARIKEIAENWFGHLICDMGYDPLHPAYDQLKEKHLDCFEANLRMALAEAAEPSKQL